MDTAAPAGLIGHFSKLVDWESRGTKRRESIDVIVLCVCVMKRRRRPMRATRTRALHRVGVVVTGTRMGKESLFQAAG